MGLWDAIRGQRRAAAPNLDNLFALPTAAITLQTALGFLPTGSGSVCYRAAEGAAALVTQGDAVSLSRVDGAPPVERVVDEFGYTWLTMSGDPEDISALVTSLHAVNSTLEEQGFASGLLCSLIGFRDPAGRVAGLVYLYKQGTFYPFCPSGPQQRGALLERQIRELVESDLPIEPDLARWMPVWGAPGL